MTMKLEVSDSQSNHSDFSCDSQSSQEFSNHDYIPPTSSMSSRPLLSLSGFEGLNSGVPTRTTATITPTQLRNLEQTIIELTSGHSDHPSHVGFVPPPITQDNHYGILSSASYGAFPAGPGRSHVSPGPASFHSATSESGSSSPSLPRRRNTGGRRPNRNHDATPEEEERRQIRRERNKQAAARCRKRRLDHTNELQEETDKLETTKRNLQDEVRKLHDEKERLVAILRNHLVACPLSKRSNSPQEIKAYRPPAYAYEEQVRVKEEVVEDHGEPLVGSVLAFDNDMFASPTTDKRIMLSAANPSVVTSTSGPLETPPCRPNRPSFLQVPVAHNKNLGNNRIAGVEISTPSNGIPFNFESLMEGGTGLTPVHPHPCSVQQRAGPDLVSPDTHNSLVSL